MQVVSCEVEKTNLPGIDFPCKINFERAINIFAGAIFKSNVITDTSVARTHLRPDALNVFFRCESHLRYIVNKVFQGIGGFVKSKVATDKILAGKNSSIAFYEAFTDVVRIISKFPVDKTIQKF